MDRQVNEELLRHFRRDLHQIPELDFDLPQTLVYVRRELEAAAEELRANAQEKGVNAEVRVFSPSRSALCLHVDLGTPHTTAFRSDMDALPVTEKTGVPYASTHEGRMHACGHDGHMAMVLGLAWWLAGHVDELRRSVLLVFQPAEETTGGAKVVCQSGVFDELGVDRIYGFHLWPDLPKGQVAGRAGALLAASNEITVRVHGRASHIAKASDGADALEATCDYLGRAYAYADARRREEAFLLKFGHMQAGQVRNQIAAEAVLEGSLRTFSVAMGKRARAELAELARTTAADHGCTADVVYSEGYPPVVNDQGLFEASTAWLRAGGIQVDEVAEPLLISEDFAWYQQWLPGDFMLLGTGTGIPLHADRFDFDEAVLMQGLAVYRRLAIME